MLREEDPEIAGRFTQVYQRRFNLLLDSQVTGVKPKDGAIELSVAVERQGQAHSANIEVDALLLATGRGPNTDLLAVSNAAVETDDRGYLKTDPYLETNVPGIWAMGDIVGGTC